ncbi:hypothetical protein HMPREF1619_04776 [Klebsiella pneumoniae 909957]|nr:hypothetical protein HMPREF1619_04776 [Klebsiella pneumoniae 909957]
MIQINLSAFIFRCHLYFQPLTFASRLIKTFPIPHNTTESSDIIRFLF